MNEEKEKGRNEGRKETDVKILFKKNIKKNKCKEK